MKLILRVLGLSAAMTVLLISALTEKEQCYEFSNICKAQVRGTDQDVANVCNYIPAEMIHATNTTKCLFECIMRHLKYLTADGLSETEYINIIRSRNHTEEYVQTYQSSAHACNGKHKLKDKCENAVVLFDCLLQTIGENMRD